MNEIAGFERIGPHVNPADSAVLSQVYFGIAMCYSQSPAFWHEQEIAICAASMHRAEYVHQQNEAQRRKEVTDGT